MTDHLYIVLLGAFEPYSPDRKLEDMSWAETVKDLAEGQFEGLNKVIEIGTGEDVTERAVRAAMDRVADRGESSIAFAELVELVCGTRAARPFFLGV